MRCRVIIVVVSLLTAASGLHAAVAGERPGPMFDPMRPVALRTPSPAPPLSEVLVSGLLDGRRAFGCAVIVAESDATVTLLTAAHVLRITQPRFVTVAGESLRLRSSGVVEGHDLAFVTAERPTRRYAVARFAPPPAPGTRVHVWGPVENAPFTYQDATIRAMDGRVADAPDGAFAIDCPACDRGDSGTGVFTDDGALLGIVTTAYPSAKHPLFVLAEGYRPDGHVALDVQQL